MATQTGVTAAPLVDECRPTGPATGAPKRLLPAELCILTPLLCCPVYAADDRRVARNPGCAKKSRLHWPSGYDGHG